MKELVPEKGSLRARDEGVVVMGSGGCAVKGLMGGCEEGMRRKNNGEVIKSREGEIASFFVMGSS